MKVYHVIVEQSDGWLAAHALEDDSVHTPGKTLDEIAANFREVAEMVCGDKVVQVEIVILSDVKVA
jgi:predicted RNase H-like HicB family nuclease